MRILPVFALCTFLLLQPFQAKALTDEDHTRYMREFPVYAQAEQRLNTAWKHLKKQMSKDAFQALLAEQRTWITTTRDAEAKAMAGPGPFTDAAPVANAYAAVTAKRAEALEARITAPASSKTHAAPVAKGTPPAQNATTQKATPAQSVAPAQADKGTQGAVTTPAAPSAKETPPQQTAPVLKGSPASKAAPAAQSAPPAGQGGSVSESPSLTPNAAFTGGTAERRAPIIGSYGSNGNLVEVKTSGKGYYVAVSTAAPDGRWICEMEGTGMLEGDILRVTSASSGKSVVVPIQIREDSLIIPATQGATCGSGGTIEGSYTRK